MKARFHLDVEDLPESIVWNPPLSDEEFEALCFENDCFKLERTKEGRILMHAPACDDTGSADSEIIKQLGRWWDTHELGRVYDSNGGFFFLILRRCLPMRPTCCQPVLGAIKKRLEDGAPLPGFCDRASSHPSLRKTQGKMLDWMANATSLAWLIDPRKRRVTVYQPGKSSPHVPGDTVEGSVPVEGFTLNLTKVWRFYVT